MVRLFPRLSPCADSSRWDAFVYCEFVSVSASEIPSNVQRSDLYRIPHKIQISRRLPISRAIWTPFSWISPKIWSSIWRANAWSRIPGSRDPMLFTQRLNLKPRDILSSGSALKCWNHCSTIKLQLRRECCAIFESRAHFYMNSQ